MAGVILSGISFQASTFAINDQAGGWHVSADTASWFSTAYAMAEAAAIPVVPFLIVGLSMRRLAVSAGVLTAVSALGLCLMDAPGVAVALRVPQGAAGGAIAVTMMVGAIMTLPPGSERRLGLALFAFASSVSTGFGAAAAAVVVSLGWRGLFAFDVVWATWYVVAVLMVLPRLPLRVEILRHIDVPAYLCLAAALALVLLVLNQGERRFWSESTMIIWTAIAAMALCGASLLFLTLRAKPLLDLTLLQRPTFGWAILGSVMFRFGLLVCSFVVPQVLTRVQGFRDEQIAGATLWQIAAHVVAFPLAWWVMRRGYNRMVLGAGLLCFAAAAGLAGFMSPGWQAADFRSVVLLSGAGQGLFLTATVYFATSGVAPAQGPTAAVLFNLGRTVGIALGSAVLGHVVTVREDYHSSILTEQIMNGASDAVDRLSRLVQGLLPLTPDQAAAQAQALGTLAASTSRQAFVLAYNDAFLVIAVLLALAACLAALLPPLPPDPAPVTAEGTPG
jgi:DHA2 family multidrug resistance protein